jgi:hypothetical protein
MAYYPQAGCAGTPRVLVANVCTQVNGASIASLRWTGEVASEQCTNLVPPPAATVAVTRARTICCP